MQRQPEPELMNEPAQVEAYATADFEQPHNHFIDLFCDYFAEHPVLEQQHFRVLDLGCGPGDISRRFAQRFPGSAIDGVDAADNMLKRAATMNQAAGLSERIRLHHHRVNDLPVTQAWPVIISNSLLHHLHEPEQLWQTLHRCAAAGTLIWIMDLLRPADEQTCQDLVNTYAADEAAILQQDFYHSLRAAFSLDEVQQQLAKQQLDYLDVRQISDRHLIIAGEYR